MTIILTAAGLHGIFPHAKAIYTDALLAGQDEFDKAGITVSKDRLGYCFANVEHECGGYTIPNLTESTAYTRERAMQVWPSRRAQIAGIPGTGIAFQKALMNAMYGGRMGNRPGTDDGYRYIGRGSCQHTGRDGYAEMERRTGLPLVDQPELACLPEHQPALICAFAAWKDLNAFADAENFRGYVRAWNGGNIGEADREALLAGNSPWVARLDAMARVGAGTRALPNLRDIQAALQAAGCEPGPIDGYPGPKTTGAVKAFQQAHSLDPDGKVGPKTLAALFPQ